MLVALVLGFALVSAAPDLGAEPVANKKVVACKKKCEASKSKCMSRCKGKKGGCRDNCSASSSSCKFGCEFN